MPRAPAWLIRAVKKHIHADTYGRDGAFAEENRRLPSEGPAYGALAPAPLLRFAQFLAERLIGGLGLVLLIEDQGRACAFDEVGNP